MTPNQILQRKTIALARVKTSNTSKNLLNDIRQIIYSLYRAKEINKTVHNNIMSSIKYNRIFMFIIMIFKSSETSDPHIFVLNLSDKNTLKRNIHMLHLFFYEILGSTIH